MDQHDQDICIVGGGGHVGLPLALAFAAAGQRVIINDLNIAAMDVIKSGRMPFIEYGDAQREMGIVKIAENNLKPLIESWYGKQS